MPLDRLIEYLQQISAVMGDSANLHLIKIASSSTAPTFLIPMRAALEAQERTARFVRGDGTKDQIRAYGRLRQMVMRDAPGVGRSAVLRSPQKVILEIPPAPEDVGVIDGVRQASTFDGLLISIGGVSEAASIRLQSLDGQVTSGFTANRGLAKAMAKLIYEPIRVSGSGIWSRSEEGKWRLEKMQIQSYEPLQDEPLGHVLSELRALKVDWPRDADAKLALEREGAT